MQNAVQIFNNPEFGEIRTVVQADDVWFFAKDIAERLGYVKTSNMLKLVYPEDKKCLTGSDLEPIGIPYPKVSFVNESGLYACIFGSKQKNAMLFKRWVTSEVLPSIRKTGSYQMPTTTDGKIALLAQGHTELKEEVDNIKIEIQALKMDLPILPIEADKITVAVKKKGVAVMGGKSANAYNNRAIRQKVYNSLYANLKYNFGTKSYKSIKRSECDKAIEIINAYQPPFFLQQEIDNANSQMNFKF